MGWVREKRASERAGERASERVSARASGRANERASDWIGGPRGGEGGRQRRRRQRAVVGREGGRREGDHQSLRPPPASPRSPPQPHPPSPHTLPLPPPPLALSSSSPSLRYTECFSLLLFLRLLLLVCPLSLSLYSYLPTPFPSFRPLSPSSHPSTPSPRAAQSALSPFSVPLSFFRSPFAPRFPPRRPAPPICELRYRLPSPVPYPLSPSVCLVSSFSLFHPFPRAPSRSFSLLAFYSPFASVVPLFLPPTLQAFVLLSSIFRRARPSLPSSYLHPPFAAISELSLFLSLRIRSSRPNSLPRQSPGTCARPFHPFSGPLFYPLPFPLSRKTRQKIYISATACNTSMVCSAGKRDGR